MTTFDEMTVKIVQEAIEDAKKRSPRVLASPSHLNEEDWKQATGLATRRVHWVPSRCSSTWANTIPLPRSTSWIWSSSASVCTRSSGISRSTVCQSRRRPHDYETKLQAWRSVLPHVVRM